MITTKMIETLLRTLEDEYSFEEILEMFDIDKTELFLSLCEDGHIDEELLERFYSGG